MCFVFSFVIVLNLHVYICSKVQSVCLQLVTHYKDMLAEREKLKTTLTQSQDRAFRRMSELREQIQLDQLAKKDLEDNYRLMLEERDEFTKVLQMQVGRPVVVVRYSVYCSVCQICAYRLNFVPVSKNGYFWLDGRFARP